MTTTSTKSGTSMFLTGTYKYKHFSPLQSSRITLPAHGEPEFPGWYIFLDLGASLECKSLPKTSFDNSSQEVRLSSWIPEGAGFVRGPPYGPVCEACSRTPKPLVRSLFGSNSMEAEVWMREAAALASGAASSARPCREMQAVQVAQLAYGLAACRVK